MSPKLPDLPKEEAVSPHNVLSHHEKAQKSPITPQFNKAKLLSDTQKLSNSVLKLSKKVNGDPPLKPIKPLK